MMFLRDFAWIFFSLGLFAVCGWSAIVPFRNHVEFPVACAALAGLILLPCLALAIHVVFVMLYWKAALLASAAMMAASLTAFYLLGASRIIVNLKTTIALAVVAAAAAVFTVTRTDLFFGDPAILYAYGTDQLGYANMADWIRLHTSNTPLTPSAEDIFGSYPDYLFKYDPRFGSFSLLAMISTVTGRPGAFAFDLTCAIVLASAAIGVSGVFSRRHAVFVVLAVILFTGGWFDFSRTGYLGKIVGFPASLFVVGLLFQFERLSRSEAEYPIAALGALAALVTCAAIMFNAQLTALCLGLMGSIFLLARALWEKTPPFWSYENVRSGITLAALVVLTIATSGIVARPLYLGFVPMSIGWDALASWSTQVTVTGLNATKMPLWLVLPAKVALAMVWAIVTLHALVKKLPEATALMVGPFVLMIALYAFDQQWRFYESVGLYVAAPACGAAIASGHDSATAGLRWFYSRLALFLLVPLGLTLPRFVAALEHFGGSMTPALYRFSLAETDHLASIVASTGAVIDVGESPHFNYFLVVELGRRGIPFQLSERAWKTFMGYRPWPAPQHEKPLVHRIVLRSETNSGSPDLVLRTTQFDLMRQQ